MPRRRLLLGRRPSPRDIGEALRQASAPMAITSYTYDTLPARERAALPAASALTAVIQPTPDS